MKESITESEGYQYNLLRVEKAELPFTVCMRRQQKKTTITTMGFVVGKNENKRKEQERSKRQGYF